MSEFQLSLLSIGAVVVVMVYLYGLWQQWRYRRSLGKPSQEPTKQPIADTLSHPQDDTDTQHFIADPVPETSPQFDDKTDFIVSMTLKFPQNAEALDGYWQRRFDYGKTIQAIGCSAATGVWERVIPESRTSYSAFKIALQLVDRNGPVSDTRLSDFRELLSDIGRKLDADMTLPMVDSAIERARELDKFCADVDQMIGINIVPSGERVLFGSEVARAVQLVGMQLQADGTFHQFDADGATLFTLSAADGAPFQHHTLDQMQVDNMTLLLDIPRVKEPVKCFDEMTLLAMEVATTLRATLVDDQRVTLDNTAISHIRAQVDAVEKSMLAGGIAPGSDQALRLFS
jgi:FtsZ-interacting cell division protein ZipA